MRNVAVVLLAVGVMLVPGCKEKNHVPGTPVVPYGPDSGVVGFSYKFSSSAADPHCDSVAIRFDWGDGDTSDWGAWVYPDAWVVRNHSWSRLGTFSVTAQARCTGSVSAWSDALQVQIGPVVLRWVKTFGGTASDRGSSVQETQGGGYIVTGHSGSFGAGGYDAWLVKTDPNGDTVWTRTFGGAGWDEGTMGQETSDGGFILAGQTASSGAGQTDLWLVKTDARGDLVWDKTFGGVDYDGGYAVEEARDGGYVATGYTWSYGAGHGDVWLIKTDAGGNLVWDRTYGIWADEEWGESVQQTQDDGYIIAAVTCPCADEPGDVWLIKTDAAGNRVWDRVYGGLGADWVHSVRQTLDGGYIAAGYTESYGAGGRDAWLIRTDADGNLVWDKTYGGAKADMAASVQLTDDGGYIVAGYTGSYGAGGHDVWLVRTGPNGDTLWTRTFGDAGDDEGCSVQRTEDGGYIVVGTTESYGAGKDDVWLVKTGPNGELDEGGGEVRSPKSE